MPPEPPSEAFLRHRFAASTDEEHDLLGHVDFVSILSDDDDSSPPGKGPHTRRLLVDGERMEVLFEDHESEADSSLLLMPIDHDDPNRMGRVWSARLNLLTSMVGGGSLSLPLAFSLAGNALGGPLLVILCGMAASFTLRALMDASARCSHLHNHDDDDDSTSGGRGGDNKKRNKASFEMVTSAAFGPSAKYVTQALVVCVCYVGALAYCVLIRDLGVPLAHAISPPPPATEPGEPHGPTTAENVVMFVVVLLVSPLCTLKTLTALRQVGALSMLSVAVLGVCVVYRSVQCNSSGEFDSPYVMPPHDYSWRDYITYFPRTFRDFADAFPVILNCYFCHFNAVPVHGELRNPTPSRVSWLSRSTIFSASSFYLIIGFFGSMYGNCTLTGRVRGNILLDFDDDDPVLAVGRMALALTIALAFPMQIIPARDTLIRLLGEAFAGGGGGGTSTGRDDDSDDGEGRVEDAAVAKEEAKMSPSGMNGLTDPLLPDEEVAVDDFEEERDRCDDSSGGGSPRGPRGRRRECIVRTVVALSLFYTAALVASLVRSVDVVWDLLGSSLVILIGFLIPCASYLRICGGGRGGHGRWRRVGAWTLIVVLVPLMVVCTVNAVLNVWFE